MKSWRSPMTKRLGLRGIVPVLMLLTTGILSSPSASVAAGAGNDTGQALSGKAAAAFARKLMELSGPAYSNHGRLKPIVVTDREVNSYLKYDRPPFLPPGVTGLTIHFKPDGIHGESSVNFDSLQPAEPSASGLGGKLLGSIFTGKQRVSALGRIASGHGSATLTIADVRVGSVTLSDWLVNWLLQTFVESQYHIDLSKPFLLPANVSRIELASGKAVFVRSFEKKND